MEKQKLINYLKEQIKAKRYSQEQFANELGITRQSLYNKLTFVFQFTAKELFKMQKLLDLSEKTIEDIVNKY